jgi:hypothetical protein
MKKGVTYEKKKSIRRKGIHAKSKTSKIKGSTNYKKPYNGQGR